MSLYIWDNEITERGTPLYKGDSPIRKAYVWDNLVWTQRIRTDFQYIEQRSDWTSLISYGTEWVPYWDMPSPNIPTCPRWDAWTSVTITPSLAPATTSMSYEVTCFYQIPWPTLTPVLTGTSGNVYTDNAWALYIGTSTSDIKMKVEDSVTPAWLTPSSGWHIWYMAEFYLLNNLLTSYWISPQQFYQIYSSSERNSPIETADRGVDWNGDKSAWRFSYLNYCYDMSTWSMNAISQQTYNTLAFSDDNYSSSVYTDCWNALNVDMSTAFSWYTLVFLWTSDNPVRDISITYTYNNGWADFPFFVTAPLYYGVLTQSWLSSSSVNWLCRYANSWALFWWTSPSSVWNIQVVQPWWGAQSLEITYIAWGQIIIRSPVQWTLIGDLGNYAYTQDMCESYATPFVWVPNWVSASRWVPEAGTIKAPAH